MAIVAEPGQTRECKSTKSPYFIVIRGAGKTPTCPKPWINRGKDRTYDPPARICAYCGPEYDPNRLARFQCCRPK